jgi:NADPH:quinone reductase
MSPSIPKNMKAVVIEKYGGPEVIHTASLPVPEVGEWDVLVEVVTAGIGSWDPWIVEGGLGDEGVFPLVLGSDGAGKVAAIGQKVTQFKVGDLVYGYAFGNPKGGFYAEYSSVPAGNIALLPKNLKLEEAGAFGSGGTTALIGLERLDPVNDQKYMIFGASGGVGHVAVQLAKRMGVDVLAVASGRDGVELVKRLGADMAINGRTDDLEAAVKKFAPEGLDAAMLFAGTEELDKTLNLVKEGGRIGYPNGVEPEPKARPGVEVIAFDGLPNPQVFAHLNEIVGVDPFHVEISRTYSMYEMPQAIVDVQKHHIGKLALAVKSDRKRAVPVTLRTKSH